MEAIKISIIVPVYNVEDYIEKCLMSVINQTFKDFELIIVNDQTNDNSINIAIEVLEKCKKINYRIINRERNGGLSAARNSGLYVAQGQYVCFLDSDDWWNSKMLEELYHIAITENADIISSNYFEVFNEKEIEIISITNKMSFSSLDACKEALLFNAIKPSAWSKMFKLELFKKNNILFPDNRYFEDVPTIINLILSADKIIVIPKCLYYYVKTRAGSIMNQKKIKYVRDYLYMINSIERLLTKNELNGIDEFKILKYNTLKAAFATLYSIKTISKKKLLLYTSLLSKELYMIKTQLQSSNITFSDEKIFKLITKNPTIKKSSIIYVSIFYNIKKCYAKYRILINKIS